MDKWDRMAAADAADRDEDAADRRVARAVAEERERWAALLSVPRRIAEANMTRADDCGMLSRALLDALRALRA